MERYKWKALQNLQQYFLKELLNPNIYATSNPTDSNDLFWREKEKLVAKAYT